MVDRLKELKKYNPVPTTSEEDVEVAIDIEEQKDQNPLYSLQHFFGDVESVKKHILVIQSSTSRIGEMNQQVTFNNSINHGVF